MNARPDVTVSVLVTIHNRSAYLAATLESVLASHFQEYEVIAVDDCSTDNSAEIVRSFAERDSRVTLYTNPSNLGDYANRLRAASLAQGRYLKYVDSDDLIYPHSLDIMTAGMDRHPDAALGLAHSLPEDESPYPWLLSPEETYRKHFLGRGCLSCGPTGAIIRRDAFDAVGGFRPEWGPLADLDLWYRLAARWPVVLMPPGLVWWRRHDSQEYRKEDAELYYLDRGCQLNLDALIQPDCPLLQTERERAMNRARQHFARRLWSLAIRRRQPVVALRLYRQSDLTMQGLIRGLGKYR